jgi:ectoine hydroxylase-related dioxygenase (phytanoyl-CoA dioxygenase family)
MSRGPDPGLPVTTTDALVGQITDEQMAAYRRDGFVRLRSMLTRSEAARFADAAVRAQQRIADFHGKATFAQLLSVWQDDDVLRELTLHPRLARSATQLAGVPLRLWHDQLLIKAPHNGAATHFHQDAPYWPHMGCRHALSAWVALVDVPVEKGCMTFLPGSQDHVGLRPQDLTEPGDLFTVAPDLRWHERVTLPLRAGDCTFHNSCTAHTAGANETDDPRIAHVVVYLAAETRYDGRSHPISDPLALPVGEPLEHPMFPRLPLG